VPPLLAIRHPEQRVPLKKGIDEFKQLTLGKLSDLRCPEHRQPPRVDFQGTTLQTVTIRMSGCCDALIALANQKIAGR
jgi:hypothetical protein